MRAPPIQAGFTGRAPGKTRHSVTIPFAVESSPFHFNAPAPFDLIPQ